jgi:hypothetical protein
MYIPLHLLLISFLDLNAGACYHESMRYRRAPTRYDIDSPAASSDADDISCNKAAPSHATLAPGMMCVTCPHLFIMGIEILRDRETVRQPFQILHNRCKEGCNSQFSLPKLSFLSAPALVCYDNACNLCRYARARDPGHFMNTIMRCDCLHWRGHSGCTETYSTQVCALFLALPPLLCVTVFHLVLL